MRWGWVLVGLALLTAYSAQPRGEIQDACRASHGAVTADADRCFRFAYCGREYPKSAELDRVKRELTLELRTVGDDAQLANVDLQDSLQKQQQTLQMLSNISKMLHDNAMAVIRKMRG